MNFDKKLGGIAAAAALAFSAQSYAIQEFDVDETPFGGNIITADKMNGGYQERITFTPINPNLSSFDTTAFATFGLFFSDGGTQPVTSQLNNTYSVYAIFTSSGLADTSGANPVFTGASGAFELFLDPNMDSVGTLGLTGADPVTVSNSVDDFLLATSSDLTTGTGILIPGIGGFFDLTFDDISLTLAGESYFVSPDPFYIRATVDGDFDSFVVAGTQTLTGDVSVVFLPEPTTLSLFGVAIAGLGFTARRKRKLA